MSQSNLIAYIPTLNRRHLEWFKKHENSSLFLISQTDAEALLPRLARNMAALPTEMIVRLTRSERVVGSVDIFDSDWDEPDPTSRTWKDWILPDEDVSHLFAGKYLYPAGCSVSYEMIWARYDMTALQQAQPVIPDVEISEDAFDVRFLDEAKSFAERSPDWWRQVGAVAVDANGKKLIVACNTHTPHEYETYMFGDPSLNRDAGQVGKSCVIHAEEAVIAQCARYGLALDGARIYVSTFPCEGCAREIAFSGIRTVYFREGYSSLNAQEVFRAHGVKIVQVKK